MTDQVSTPKNVHEAILMVMGQVGYVQKSRSPNLNYSFAGEAALIAALRPHMIEAGLYMTVVDYREITRENYTARSGTPMNSTQVFGIVRFTHAPSGTFADVASIGEGADAGDKSANKAATGMYKYALRQTFCIETGDDPDTTPSSEQERKAKTQNAPEASKTAPKEAQAAVTPPAAQNANPPAKSGEKPASTAPAKPAIDPNSAPTVGMVEKLNKIIADAEAVGIKANIDVAKLTVGSMTTIAESLKKQIAARKPKA